MKKSRRLLFVGASTLLVIVGLLAFGEQARHGHYHLDGGRGWDLPPATSLDAGHFHVQHAINPKIILLFNQNEGAPVAFVLPLETPLFKRTTPLIWFRLRPPPQA